MTATRTRNSKANGIFTCVWELHKSMDHISLSVSFRPRIHLQARETLQHGLLAPMMSNLINVIIFDQVRLRQLIESPKKLLASLFRHYLLVQNNSLWLVHLGLQCLKPTSLQKWIKVAFFKKWLHSLWKETWSGKGIDLNYLRFYLFFQIAPSWFAAINVAAVSNSWQNRWFPSQ